MIDADMNAKMTRSPYPPRTVPKTDYIYIERWPDNRVYVGWSVDPWRRHRQHIGELARGAEDVRDEIKRQGGVLPEMTVLAIVDIYVWYPGTYESVIRRTAREAGFSVIDWSDYLDEEDSDELIGCDDD